MDLNESNWVRRAVAGDTDAFGVLVAKHSPWLFARIARRLRSREVAEDLTSRATPINRQRICWRSVLMSSEAGCRKPVDDWRRRLKK